MKITVIGAGALGTFYSAMMASSGYDVTLVCREKDVNALKKGIAVTGNIEMTAHPAIMSSPPESDLFLIIVKSYDIAGAAEMIADISPGSPVVVIHNGLGGDETAASILGKGRVAAGVSYSGVTLLEPGKVRLTGYTETVLGSVEETVQAGLSEVREVLESSGLKARTSDDIRSSQWEKMYANLAINPVTAITGLRNGMILEVPELKALAASIVREAAEVSAALGVRTQGDPVGKMYRVVSDTYNNRSSMLQDVTRGKPTEIDVLNGKVSLLGHKARVPTPINDTITALIKGIEHNKIGR